MAQGLLKESTVDKGANPFPVVDHYEKAEANVVPAPLLPCVHHVGQMLSETEGSQETWRLRFS